MEKIRIQDDLYNYVNQEWLEKAEIPADRPATGGFVNLDIDLQKTMIDEFNQMEKSGVYPNSYLERTIKLYTLAKNVKKRNREGIKPALKMLKRIQGVKNIANLNRNLASFIEDGITLPFEVSTEVDMKDASKHILYIQGPSLILPDTTYYQEPKKAQGEQIIGLWANMVQQLLGFTGLTDEEKALYLQDAIKFDAIAATLVKSSEEWSEYAKMYNVTPTKKVNNMVKPLKLSKALEKIFGFIPENMSVADPRFLKGFKTFFNEENFEAYKHWAYIKELIGASKYLSEDLRNIGTSYMRALTGVAEMPSVEKYAYGLSSNYFAEPVGLYYGEKYFGEAAKKDVVDMVHEIIDTYKERMSINTFLQEETKKLAINKLSTIVVKMGYPDEVRDIYNKLMFDDKASLFEAVSELSKIRRIDDLQKLDKPVDRSLWAMPGHMVNACYNPFSNDITFPAAILQPPFYSIKQTRSQNLGGIGAVIGHEISHAFDNNGAKFDEHGNMANWWKKEDLKEFNNMTKAMIKEFEGIELPWGPVNSKLIVSENIADNGGMAVTLDIMGKMKEKSYEEYFINWAKVWCLKAKPEYLAILLSVDVHAPTILRANMQPRNFTEWYETFGVKKSDKMYIAPNKRVVIW